MHIVASKQGAQHRVAILWDSVTEPATVAPTLKVDANRALAASSLSGRNKNGREQTWFGAPSVETLFERITRGWGEGAAKLQAIATKEINPVSIRRRRQRADQGDELDMQAVWRGDLSRAWTRTRRQTRAGANRCITIVCNLTASANVDADRLFWRGAAALKLADELTASGYNVAIYAATSQRDTASGARVDSAQFVSIKDADQPLDLSALAALTAMPGFFRTSMFAGIITACDHVGTTADGMLGYPDHDNIKPAMESLGLSTEGATFIQRRVDSKEAAEAWIDECLAQIENPELAGA